MFESTNQVGCLLIKRLMQVSEFEVEVECRGVEGAAGRRGVARTLEMVSVKGV